MARPATSAKLTRGHLTKKEKNIRLAVENRLRGGEFDESVPEEFRDDEARAYIWLCEVLRPADILGEPDRETVKLAAITIARINQLDELIRHAPDLLTDKDFNTIRNSYMAQYGKFCRELCLSPGARNKIGSMARNQKAEDPLIKVLGK